MRGLFVSPPRYGGETTSATVWYCANAPGPSRGWHGREHMMLSKMAARKLQEKLLGKREAARRGMSYREFRNWDRLVRERPNK